MKWQELWWANQRHPDCAQKTLSGGVVRRIKGKASVQVSAGLRQTRKNAEVPQGVFITLGP